MHDFRLFKERGLPPALHSLCVLMGRVIVWADSAYEAIPKYYPRWDCRIQEKAKRNHPLTELQKLTNTCKTKVRILIEHVIRRIKVFRCCADRGRKLTAPIQTRYWNIVAGLWNQRQTQTLGITVIFN